MKSIAIIVMSLSLGSFVVGAADADPKPRQAPAVPDWAKQFDKNGDGKLDPSEREAAMKSRRDEMYKKYDKNGDGTLDADERKAMSEERRKEREAGTAKQKAAQEQKKNEKKEEKKEEKKQNP